MFHPIDVHVGKRVTQRRVLLGMSQKALGKAIGITFQQIQKYERGANRLGASRLYEFACVLDVPVEYFFEELSGAAKRTPTRSKGQQHVGAPLDPNADPMTRPETLKLVRAYFKIRNLSVRREIAAAIKTLAREEHVNRRRS
jgi:transcriptional regulator with XRE-family HTH domain